MLALVVNVRECSAENSLSCLDLFGLIVWFLSYDWIVKGGSVLHISQHFFRFLQIKIGGVVRRLLALDLGSLIRFIGLAVSLGGTFLLLCLCADFVAFNSKFIKRAHSVTKLPTCLFGQPIIVLSPHNTARRDASLLSLMVMMFKTEY